MVEYFTSTCKYKNNGKLQFIQYAHAINVDVIDLLLYSALIFLMKYKTEIIKVKRSELKDCDRKLFNEWLRCLCLGIVWHCVYFSLILLLELIINLKI